MSDKQLAQPGPATLANPGGHRKGLMPERLRSRYRVMPTAVLLQKLSRQVENRIEGATPGILWDTMTEAPCPRSFIIVKFFGEAIKFVDPRKPALGVEWRCVLDEKTPDSVWRSLDWLPDDRTGRRTPPEANEVLNAIVLFEGQKEPMVIRFSVTSLKDGKKLYSMVEHRGGNVWDTVYEWDVFERKNDRNEWFAMRFTPRGNSTEEDREYAETMFSALEGITIQAEAEDSAGENIDTSGRRSREEDPRYGRRAPEPNDGEDPRDYARRATREFDRGPSRDDQDDGRDDRYPAHLRRR